MMRNQGRPEWEVEEEYMEKLIDLCGEVEGSFDRNFLMRVQGFFMNSITTRQRAWNKVHERIKTIWGSELSSSQTQQERTTSSALTP